MSEAVLPRSQYVETQDFVQTMRRHAVGELVIEAFCSLYERYRAGESGKIPWAEVEQPGPGDIVPYQELQREDLRRHGEGLLPQLAVIRVNGGLGTTMKMDRAKSLVAVRDGESFLDLSVQQILRLRAEHRVPVPLLLMNSFRTREDTLAALARYDLAVRGLPLDFMQNMVPRIDRTSGRPAALPGEEGWAPPGHGDIYLALWSSGLLDQLLQAGIRWVMVSNVDNLAATVDLSLLGYLDRRGVDFAMEVTDKSLADIKGGTLIRHRGRLMLLETAQVEVEHLADFQDLSVFSVFNTNTLWWRLDATLAALRGRSLSLPMIVNPKRVGDVEVVQLETAMGAAIGCFERAVGVRVPRSRFAPVKATCDLLAVRSDAYIVDEALAIRPAPSREAGGGPPVVRLDDRFYKGISDFEDRFPYPLSLVGCQSFTVEGDLRFGRDIRIEGEVVLRNRSAEQRLVPDGAVFGSGAHDL